MSSIGKSLELLKQMVISRVDENNMLMETIRKNNDEIIELINCIEINTELSQSHSSCSSSKIEKDKKRKMSNREFLDKLNEMDDLW